MPLHLLGKKSWNVYNADNVARVKRDEAKAKAAEEAEEQHMQEVDAERRLAILRGEVPPPLPEAQQTSELTPNDGKGQVSRRGSGRRKRKRPGENDTDFELRLANEREDSKEPTERTRKQTSSAPITDRAGHIDLLGDSSLRRRSEKYEDAEEEVQRKKQELEDQYTRRFSNVTGRNGPHDAWYSKLDSSGLDETGKDVWENEDSGRKGRDAQRKTSIDPLAMMKKGASQIRMLNRERKVLQEERNAELRQLREAQDKRDSRRRDEKRSRHGDRRRSSDYRDERSRASSSTHSRRDKYRGNEQWDRRRSRSPDRRRHRQRHET